ncbi:MutS protein msh4 [Neocucurbitaria cava]|uniref:MutS protein msh4 n=1 Tax=Neocucurbitaria cava TaxID=798079 RepID=A0A9W9CMS4_9PLEO|nr:MutS protein msh4 [Neocucurbitaria cava]
MFQRFRPSTSYSTSSSTSYGYTYGDYNTTTTSRPGTRRGTGRVSTARPRTGASTIARVEAQRIICAVAESRGISPTVGLAFVNLDTGEATLCQICDSQTYVRTVHKLKVYGPSEILIVSTAASPKSKLFSIIEENLEDIGSKLTLLDRRYWAEATGYEYIQSLAFKEDVEAIKVSVTGNYYAALKYTDLGLGLVFALHSLRMRYEPSEGSMMIDVSTIYSLEVVQNLQNSKSRDCLFGLLNETLTPMGARLLRNNVLQPLTDPEVLNTRYAAVDDLTKKEDLFFATRAALKNFLDADKILTQLIVKPTKSTIQTTEQAINQVIMLKQFVNSVNPIYEALTGTRSTMLNNIRELCAPENVTLVQELIDRVINEDTTYAKQPLELRNQRTYAVKSGVNGLLDVARTTYKEATEDAYQHSTELAEEYDIQLDLKYDNARQFYIKIPASELEGRALPPIFTNIVRRKKNIECQTLELMKRNQKINVSHQEVILMSDQAVEALIEGVRIHMSVMFKICEAIALLDMIAAFAHLVTLNNYTQPQLTDTLGIEAGRHPIKEKIMQTKFVPNDVIPATYASFPILHQLFARLGMDDNIETNVSTFAAEMKDIAFILRNVDRRSLATQGVVKQSHYGLALARVVPLPPGVVEHATFVAHKLERHMLRKKKTPETVLKEKRRKLILNLKEHLVQAHAGVLEGEVLTAWLKELQKEFINRMTALEVEAASAGQESDDEDEVMEDRSEHDEEERPSTYASQPSVMTISSHMTTSGSASESTVRAMSEASTLRAVSDNER